MYRVQLSPLAKEDLLKIKKHLQEEFGNTNVDLIIKDMIESIKKIERFPLMGRPLANLIDIPTDYMYFVIKKNYVFYRLQNQTVKIIRILDTRQDFMRILFDDI